MGGNNISYDGVKTLMVLVSLERERTRRWNEGIEEKRGNKNIIHTSLSYELSLGSSRKPFFGIGRTYFSPANNVSE